MAISEMEFEILELISNQYTSKDIAEKLFISLNTIESHRRKLLEKFAVKNIAGLSKKR